MVYPLRGGGFYSTRKTHFIATFPGKFAHRFNPPNPGGGGAPLGNMIELPRGEKINNLSIGWGKEIKNK